jgi:membrane-associated protease RseP (regulator of RpoE activity)
MNGTVNKLVALSLATAALLGAAHPSAAQSADGQPHPTALSLAWDYGDAQQQVINFLGSHQAHREAILSLNQCRNCHQADAFTTPDKGAAAAIQPQGPWIGVSVGPADALLRAHLRLPEGAGVVVTQVVPDSPAHQAGVEPHDVLVAVNGKPIASSEDLKAHIRAATGNAALHMKLVRRGKPLEKQVTPQTQDYVAWLNRLNVASQPAYRIGVASSPPDATLREQLGLGEAGVVVTEVEAHGPADAAGVRVGDILLSANGKPLAKQDDLAAEVQRAGESAVELELVRGGATVQLSARPVRQASTNLVPVSAASRWVQPDRPRELMLVDPTYVDVLTGASRAATQPAVATGEQLQKITEQLDQLRQAVDALRADLDRQRETKSARE